MMEPVIMRIKPIVSVCVCVLVRETLKNEDHVQGPRNQLCEEDPKHWDFLLSGYDFERMFEYFSMILLLLSSFYSPC